MREISTNYCRKWRVKRLEAEGYDIIGDIHGHGTALLKLLNHLGYTDSRSGFQHPVRKVIFLGDFIDRGEHLEEHKLVLDTVMKMVTAGHALAVMGNHEFNALAYHTQHEGRYLRAHTEKNTHQHQAFLNEFENDPESKQRVLEFFYDLPLWLELDGLRVIHACWDEEHIATLRHVSPDLRISPDLLIRASTEGTIEYQAIETLLKGVEIELPNGVTFPDKDKHPRSAIRVQWWNQQATCLGDMALPFDVDIGAAAEEPVPTDIPRYDDSERPCFIGHYWLHGTPAPLSPNVACLDYSVAKNGKLVAYRWSGESILTKVHFTHC